MDKGDLITIAMAIGINLLIGIHGIMSNHIKIDELHFVVIVILLLSILRKV